MGGRNRTWGAQGEQLAADYLQEHGLVVLARNYRYDRAEVDLVCRDGEELVFVEVKSRRSAQYGDPEEAVTELKQEQLRKAAEGYCQEFQLDDKFYRFDIVAILQRGEMLILRHIKDAF